MRDTTLLGMVVGNMSVENSTELLFSTVSSTISSIANSTQMVLDDLLPTTANILTTVASTVSNIASSTQTVLQDLLPAATTLLPPNCRQVEVSCFKSQIFNKTTVTSLAFLTTTVLPEIWTRLNMTPNNDYFSTEYSTFDWINDTSSTPTNIYASSDYDRFTDGNLTSAFTEYNSDEYNTNDTNSSVTTFRTTAAVEDIVEDIDEYYDYGNEENENARRKRDADNIFEQMQQLEWQFNEESGTEHTPYDVSAVNATELISSTISAFLDNMTTSPDEWNTTYVSEMWTNYVTNLDDSEFTVGDDDAATAATEICYDIICDPIDTTTDPNDDYSSTIGANDTTTPAQTQSQFVCPTLASPIPITVTPYTLLNNTKIALSKSRSKYTGKNLTKFINGMSEDQQMNLSKHCWETMFGQELVKLTVMDLVCSTFIQTHTHVLYYR